MNERAIYLWRAGVSERTHDTRLNVLCAVSDRGDEVWIADGDEARFLLRIPAEHVDELIEKLQAAKCLHAAKPEERLWYGEYPPPGSPGGRPIGGA